MDFQNMIGSLIEIEVHDAKVVEVTNDQTDVPYLEAISSEIGPKLQLCCEEAVLYYGFRPDRGRWATSK